MAIAAVVAGVAGWAHAKSYYVAPPPVGDDGNAGTQAAPFATIQKALDMTDIGWLGSIRVNSGTYKIDRELVPASSLTGFYLRSVTGNPDDVIIDAQGKCRCFASNSGGYNQYLVGLTFINGVSDEKGGGVKLNSNGILDNCVISNCTAKGDGGGLHGSSLTRVSGTRIVNCSSGGYGGGARLVGGDFSGTGFNFISNCVAAASGGGIYGTDNIRSIANVEIVDCQAKTAGGIYAGGSTTAWSTNVILRSCRVVSSGETQAGGAEMRSFTLSDYVVSDCHAVNTGNVAHVQTRGGGLFLYNSTLTNAVITGCSAGSSVADQYVGYEKGGGIATYYYDGSARQLKPQIVGCIVRDCCVSNGASTITAALGGGIGGDSADLLIEDCEVSGNRADGGGGGIYCAQAATIRNCTVTNNVCIPPWTSGASGGSGIRAAGASTIDSCLIEGNSLDKDRTAYNGGGSAVWLGEGGKLVNSAVVGNTGSRSVAFQWVSCGNVLVSNCLFKANRGLLSTSGGRGGMFMLYNMTDDCLVTDCRFIDNEGSGDLGALMDLELSSTADATLRIRNCLITGTKGKGLIWANASTQPTKYFGKLAIENCTIVSNMATASEMIVPYYENSNYITRDRVFVRGSAILFNNGRNAFNGVYKDSTNVTFSCAETIGTEDGNLVYDASKPLFADLANGNFRPAPGSQLLNAVPKADWMGDGSKGSKLDVGTGYELCETGGRGAKVVWTDVRPRLFGNQADIGCCEYYIPPGLLLLFH